MSDTNISPKSRLVALLLCFFLGFLGVHRFYVGKNGTGILMIVTAFTDKQGRRVFKWAEAGSI